MKRQHWVLAILVLLFALRHDLWWWNADKRVLGLPIGLTWHLALCLAVAVVMGLLARIDDAAEEAGEA